MDSLTADLKKLREKCEHYEGDIKLHKRMIEKTNQPQSYMIAEVERSEKELHFAQKKIKSLEQEVKKMKADNEHLRVTKNGLNDDL